MNIIISAGGTGGHIYPAVGIINRFKKSEKDLNILYIGTHNRMEKDIIPALGIKYEPIEIYGFSKKKIFRDIKNIFLIRKAEKRCEELMNEFKPDIVIGVGGYVTYPVIKTAQKLGIKTAIHEQNSIPGKSNKALAKGTDIVFTSYQNSSKYFQGAKRIIYSGNPCGENALTTTRIHKEDLGFKKDKKLVLIVSGSLGSVTINNEFAKLLSLVEDTDDFEILYITGKDYYDDFVKNNKFSKNVKVLPFLDNMSGLLRDVDLIVSRAGAGTISEILALEVPSILIPSPYVANNHQYYNALDLKEKKVSMMVEEKDLSANRMYIYITDLLSKNNKTYKEMKDHLKELSMKKASTIIYDEVKELIK